MFFYTRIYTVSFSFFRVSITCLLFSVCFLLTPHYYLLALSPSFSPTWSISTICCWLYHTTCTWLPSSLSQQCPLHSLCIDCSSCSLISLYLPPFAQPFTSVISNTTQHAWLSGHTFTSTTQSFKSDCDCGVQYLLSVCRAIMSFLMGLQ